jgi:fructose-1,6-bisphosphatase/inositol monophosphatase family enzyme
MGKYLEAKLTIPEMPGTFDGSIDLRLVREWVTEAGRIALSQRESLNAQTKSDNTLVTSVDRQIENFLVKRISHYYPGHNLLAEEGSYFSHKSEFLWAIDPIDGTRAFASGLPIWGISVGILYQDRPLAGVFYMPVTGEMYWGTEEAGFYCDRPIVPRETTDIRDPLAFIAVPSNAHLRYDISFPRLRSLGSTTAHLAYVAQGTAMAALTRNIQMWDIAAVLPLLKAANVGLVYLTGKAFDLQILLDGSPTPEPLLAAPVNLLEEVRKLIKVKPNQL